MNTTDTIRTDAPTDLLPCPFCGGEAVRSTLKDEANFGGDVITCRQCYCSSHVEFGEKSGLVDAWNSRVAASPAEPPNSNVTGEDESLRAAALFLTDDHKRDSLRSMLVDGKPMTRADLAQRLLDMIEFARRATQLQSASAQINDASVAAIQYALDAEEGFEWLSLWNEGEFDRCRHGWPDAPDDCYIGADPIHPETQRLLAVQAAEVDVRAEFEAIRNAALDEAAAVVTDHQREGREWVPQSLWDNLARECAARIRALKKAPIPELAVEQHEATPADVCKQPSITPVDCVPGRGPFVINKDGRIDINPAFALSRPAADVVAKSPTVESETTAPKRAAQLLLMLEADTAEHLACALTDLETQIRSGRARTYTAGGNAFSSYKCRLTIADHPTHSEYMRELEQWLDRNTAANGGAA
ncbi:Lar family restriction alleviation protein [Burkholderia cenocepacia]|uniref:Lar family restriction alleviation protein n=1 Tax=Burkholderia cenocepacia TaxID=95486 RepID=UPI001F1E0F37|nr:Lar family restriction alleviation protein [Burkholderia cenocepacia]MCG0577032.1 Lar family restriction alleviation protein [Burkholderia cenocepacia]